MKKILVFGANGGIGQYLIDYFIDFYSEQYLIIGVGRKKEGDSRIQYIQMDIRKAEEFSKLPKDVYAVVDLAGMMPARMSGYYPREYLDVNIIGTFNILEYCRESKVNRIIFTQSFGDIKDYAENNVLLRPDLPPKFNYATDHSIYIISKNTAVDMIKSYNAMYGLRAFIFRLPTVYSWSSNDSYYVDGILRKRAWRLLIDKAMNGEDIEVWGDSSRKKDMLYVKDLCQLIELACNTVKTFGIYNAGTGVGTSLLDQIKGMIEVFGENKKSNIIFRPDMPDAPQYIMDISNAVKDLEYNPKYMYIDMLTDMKKEMYRHC